MKIWDFIITGEQDFDKSKAYLSLCVELNPGKYNAWVKLASIYQKEKNYSEAEKVITRALSITPDHERLWCELGKLL